MGLRLVTLVSYLPRNLKGTSGANWATHRFIKALKGEGMNGGYADVRVRGKTVRLRNANLASAPAWAGQMAADFLRADKAMQSTRIALVPVPSSNAVSGATFDRFPTRRIASEIVNALVVSGGVAASMFDILRWREEWPSARKNGTRNPVELAKNLIVTSPVTDLPPLILIDDVTTTGGHIKACAFVLGKAGANVALALCVGRTVQEEQQDPYAVVEASVDPSEAKSSLRSFIASFRTRV